MTSDEAMAILGEKFDPKHMTAALGYFTAATEKYAAEDWDGVALKAGKFVEAVTKALIIHCGKVLPSNMRHFKAGSELRQLEQASGYSDTVRIVIPKACIFIYEVVNTRGGRHDAGEIDANGIDAKVIVPQMQWILAELVRFCSVGGDINRAARLIDGLTNRVYSMFEKIDDRTYVIAEEMGAPAVAILLAYDAYPNRISKRDLEAAIVRHGFTKSIANKAILRNRTLFDDMDGALKLRTAGRQRAEEFLSKSTDSFKNPIAA